MSETSPAAQYAKATARDIAYEQEAIANYARVVKELEAFKRLQREAQVVLAECQEIAARPTNELIRALVASSLHRRAAWVDLAMLRDRKNP